MPSTRTVVFVCLHGAANGVIAGAYLNRLSGERRLDIWATAAGLSRRPKFHSKCGRVFCRTAWMSEMNAPGA